MASKIRLNYQLRMLIPMLATLWTVIFGMALWHTHNEQVFRENTIREQLKLINARILYHYGKEYNPQDFLRFLGQYYLDNPLYDRIRISVYDDGKLIYNIGSVININPDPNDRSKVAVDRDHRRSMALGYNNFFYLQSESDNGRIKVVTVLPYDDEISAATIPGSSVWIFVTFIAIVASIFAFLSTRFFSENIKILRSIAKEAATNDNFIPTMEFPHDELGDINRQIISLYTERTKAYERIQQEHSIAMHAMEEKARMKRQLTSNINHELKTPIGVIKGYLDTIVSNPDMDEASRKHFIVKALEHANRLSDLSNNISAITRLEDGAAAINTEPLDYHDIVYSAYCDLSESNMLGSMEFVYDIPSDCMVQGNAALLTAMLSNLVKNAVAYSKGTQCGVRLVASNDRFFTFEFYDNGTGVDERHIDHLFERFYRVDSGRSRKNGGTGLGLPIVQSTVEALGGTIKVENRPRGGLAFTYTLRKA